MHEDPFHVLKHPFERSENPQRYSETPYAYVHKEPARHMLGLIGGNAVSLPQGNIVDVESELLGLNFPLTHCPGRQYQAPPLRQSMLYRKSTKGSVSINVAPRHLPEIQMWPYQATFAPIPMKVTQCGRPEKY